MGREAWQLKPVGSSDDRTLSTRHFKRSAKGGRTTEWIAHKRKPTRHRDGKWFAHGLEVYQLWWEFLVRAYQAKGIVVDRSRYANWGEPSDFLNIDIWSAKSRKDGFWRFWRSHGIELFAENEDRGVSVITPDKAFRARSGMLYLEIPKGTPAKELMGAIKRLVQENADKKKKSHIPTAKEAITSREIRADAYRRWLKMWDMRFVPFPQYSRKFGAGERGGDVFSVEIIASIHGAGGDYGFALTYRNLWIAKKIVKNVARGEFPGTIV